MHDGDWGDSQDRTLLIRLQAAADAQAVLVSVHPHHIAREARLPDPGPGRRWVALFDSSRPGGAPDPEAAALAAGAVAVLPARALLIHRSEAADR